MTPLILRSRCVTAGRFSASMNQQKILWAKLELHFTFSAFWKTFASMFKNLFFKKLISLYGIITTHSCCLFFLHRCSQKWPVSQTQSERSELWEFSVCFQSWWLLRSYSIYYNNPELHFAYIVLLFIISPSSEKQKSLVVLFKPVGWILLYRLRIFSPLDK